MACCDCKSIVISIIWGNICLFALAPDFRGSFAETFFAIMGCGLLIYAFTACLYNFCQWICCCFKRQQPEPYVAVQQPQIYANDIHQPIIYRPPNNHNYQQINNSNYTSQNRSQQRQDYLIYRQSYNQSQCTICLQSFSPNQSVIRLQCGHKFHQNCIIDWARKQSNCPVCRTLIQ